MLCWLGWMSRLTGWLRAGLARLASEAGAFALNQRSVRKSMKVESSLAMSKECVESGYRMVDGPNLGRTSRSVTGGRVASSHLRGEASRAPGRLRG